jgi:hypothetical protein
MRHALVTALHVLLVLVAGRFSNCRALAQDSAPASLSAKSAQTANSPQPNDAYTALLARVQQGDMTVDFRAFRIAGAQAGGYKPWEKTRRTE